VTDDTRSATQFSWVILFTFDDPLQPCVQRDNAFTLQDCIEKDKEENWRLKLRKPCFIRACRPYTRNDIRSLHIVHLLRVYGVHTFSSGSEHLFFKHTNHTLGTKPSKKLQPIIHRSLVYLRWSIMVDHRGTFTHSIQRRAGQPTTSDLKQHLPVSYNEVLPRIEEFLIIVVVSVSCISSFLTWLFWKCIWPTSDEAFGWLRSRLAISKVRVLYFGYTHLNTSKTVSTSVKE
jgi:hypothetical protein